MATIFVPNEFYCPITGDLMKDPVSEPDGHTYERDAIMKWLSKNMTSPMTRKPLYKKDMKDNISMKKSIESIKDKLSEDQLKIDSKILDVELKKFNDVLNDITMKASVRDNILFIKTDVPLVEHRPPVDIVLCIDISGSMGSDAPVKGNDGKSTSFGISVLSLTVAAAKTILKTLNEKDNISIVTYSEVANELFTNIPCNNENKVKVSEGLDSLKPTNTTNIWNGLKTSMDCLRINSPPNKLKVIKLLTDGVPNIEPNRGHEYMLEKYFKEHDFKCMVNCYGFGYHLKSELLDNLSRISGGDGYSFIPDSSLLGNIFIHGVSNFFTTALTNIPVKVVYKDNTMDEFYINSLKYGQSKNIVMGIVKEVSHVEMNIKGNVIKSDLYDMLDDYYYEQLYRFKSYNMIDALITMKKFNDDGFKTSLDNLILEITFNADMKDNEYIKNILFDLEGQVKESLNMTTQGDKEDWFTKWGIHYLRSLKVAYENEICNNFKDKGVSNFTGELFEKLRDEVSDIFDNMEPPKKNIVAPQYGNRGYVFTPIQSMQSYRNAGGGCCAPGSMVKMEDGSLKAVENIKKGDEVVTVHSKNGVDYIDSGIIECVVITECSGGFQKMISLDGITGNKLNITPYHPVIMPGSNEWVYPNSLGKTEMIKCPEMYTFVTSNRKSIIVEDYVYATYGHGLSNNSVIQHDLFGTDMIIRDLKNFVSYKSGKVYLVDNMFIRNNKGDVCKIGLEWRYTDYMSMMYNSKM
jgi:Mg-chelatase subunit ChlD